MANTRETVTWVHHWNESLFSFRITRPQSFRFRSGEFVMIGLEIEGKPLMRAYSIASPHYAEELEFLSIAVPEGPLTSHLCKIQPGDEVLLASKSVGTLVLDAVLPGKNLHLIGTGTGLAPWMSIIRDPDTYSRFEKVTVQHTVRNVSDLAYKDLLMSHLAGDPLVQDEALVQLTYDAAVTRDTSIFRAKGWNDFCNKRITARIEEGFYELNPETDRVMLCGSMAMIKDTAKLLEGLGFEEGAVSKPGTFVLERAFVG